MDIDQSLDAMIKSAPAKKKGGAGGKKRPKKAAPAPKNKVGGVKAKVIAKPRRGPKASAMAVDGAWTHDKFQGQGGATKLAVSNLHVNVTNQDVRELFGQVGRVKKSGLNFNEHGKSKGTAEVIYASRADALKAIKTYNGVKLDGKPLRIDLVGGAASSGNVLSSGVVVSGVKVGGGGGRQARVVVTGGNKGPVAARGGRKVVAKVVPRPHAAKKPGDAKGKKGGRGKKAAPKPTPMTAEQLDAQLDSYKGAAAMQE